MGQQGEEEELAWASRSLESGRTVTISVHRARRRRGERLWRQVQGSRARLKTKPPGQQAGQAGLHAIWAGQPSTSQGAPARRAPTGPLPWKRGSVTPRMTPCPPPGSNQQDRTTTHSVGTSDLTHAPPHPNRASPPRQSPSASPHRPHQMPTDTFLRFEYFY